MKDLSNLGFIILLLSGIVLMQGPSLWLFCLGELAVIVWIYWLLRKTGDGKMKKRN